MEALDQYAGVARQIIDERVYEMICKHRRLRIENELKVIEKSLLGTINYTYVMF